MSAANGDNLQRLVRQGRAWIRKHRHYWGGVLVPQAYDVSWEVVVVLSDGTRHRTCGETQREARQKMREYLANAEAHASATKEPIA